MGQLGSNAMGNTPSGGSPAFLIGLLLAILLFCFGPLLAGASLLKRR